jgi:hypothetical protein
MDAQLLATLPAGSLRGSSPGAACLFAFMPHNPALQFQPRPVSRRRQPHVRHPRPPDRRSPDLVPARVHQLTGVSESRGHIAGGGSARPPGSRARQRQTADSVLFPRSPSSSRGFKRPRLGRSMFIISSRAVVNLTVSILGLSIPRHVRSPRRSSRPRGARQSVQPAAVRNTEVRIRTGWRLMFFPLLRRSVRRGSRPGTRSKAPRTASPRGLARHAACGLLCGGREIAERVSPPEA